MNEENKTSAEAGGDEDLTVQTEAPAADSADEEAAAATAAAPVVATSPEIKVEAGEAAAPVPRQRPDTRTRVTASRGMAEWLGMHRVSLAFTSYQTGQLFLIGVTPQQRISVQQRNFARAMGLWANPSRIVLASVSQIWRLENMLRPTERVNKTYDRLYVPRMAHTTGDLDVHELGVDKSGRLIFVNTKYSCLATVHPSQSFQPLWKPSFISKLAAEDRCHLNGLAMVDSVPTYVTAISRSDVVTGWRERRHEGGVLIDIASDAVVTDELSMPHSPRVHDGVLYVLDSGRGYLCRVDRKTGRRENVAFCPGFLRGLAFAGGHAIVTTSLPRDGAFTGLELDENIRARDGEPHCGVYIINLSTGDIVHWIRLDGFIKELFDVQVLPGVRCPMAIGLTGPEVQQTISFPPEFAPLVPA